MKKMRMHTPNLADENYKKLAALFPNAVTEMIDPETGEVVRAIDKDVLMQEISAHVVEGREERYQFTWPDKKKAMLAANAPISATLRPVQAAGGILFDGLDQLAQAEFHVMEIGNRFSQRLIQVGKHRLEVSEGFPGIIGILRIDSLVGIRIRDENGDAPVFFAIEIPCFFLPFHRDEPKGFPVNVRLAGSDQLRADVFRHRTDVVLQQIHVRKDGVIDMLEDIIGTVPFRNDLVSVINQPVPERRNFLDCSPDVEMSGYFFQRCHDIVVLIISVLLMLVCG